MSRVEELLRRKRQAQIKQLEGGAPDADSHEVDRELANVRAPEVQRARVKQGRLHFRNHARLRMAQRGMSTRVVYAIWQAGEVHSSNGRLVFRVTDKALQDTTARTREVLQSWRGSAIVVQPTDNPSLDPVLVTVLADGEDTYTHRDGTANDQRRRRRMHPNTGRSDEDDS